MVTYFYRLEVGNKCVFLDDIGCRITLETSAYTPMTFEKAERVANEIGIDVVKVFEITKHYSETEKAVSPNIFKT